MKIAEMTKAEQDELFQDITNALSKVLPTGVVCVWTIVDTGEDGEHRPAFWGSNTTKAGAIIILQHALDSMRTLTNDTFRVGDSSRTPVAPTE